MIRKGLNQNYKPRRKTFTLDANHMAGGKKELAERIRTSVKHYMDSIRDKILKMAGVIR